MRTDRAPRSRMSPERLAELFDAVLELLGEVGYERLTFDSVAARARTSKATLYRQWENKPGLIMAALTHSRSRHRPLFDAAATTSLDEELGRLTRADQFSNGDLRMGFTLLQAASADAEFATALRAATIEPAIHELAVVFERAADRGEIERDEPLFRRLAYMILTDLAFFPLVSGQTESAASRQEFFRAIVRPALTFIEPADD